MGKEEDKNGATSGTMMEDGDTGIGPHGRERALFVALPNCGTPRNPLACYPDCVATVDVDPDSSNYCKIVSLLEMPNEGDELHHFEVWNSASSSSSSSAPASHRRHLIFPTRSSGRIYVVDATDPRELRLEKTIESETLTALGVSYPNRVLCTPDSVLISTMGDERLENSGNFLRLDPLTFEPQGLWAEGDQQTKFGCDFSIHSGQNVMLSTGCGSPAKFRHGMWPSDVAKGNYSNHVYVWELRERRLAQTIQLEGDTGWMPVGVRFVPAAAATGGCHAFVCTLLGSAIYHLWREKDDDCFQHRLAVAIPPKKVEGWQCPSFVPQFIQHLLVSMNWALPKMPAFTSDMVISRDGRFLYISNWLHGDVRQYDISDPFNIKMVAQCFIAGSIKKGTGVEVIEDEELTEKPEGVIWEDGTELDGGPHMLRLSRDGRRLYVTNSLYLPWDTQFYPELTKKGSTMVQLDVDTRRARLSVNKEFRVHFGESPELPKGPYAAREIQFADYGELNKEVAPSDDAR